VPLAAMQVPVMPPQLVAHSQPRALVKAAKAKTRRVTIWSL
jgi:hypothetical protein